MSRHIPADAQQLEEQASRTARNYLVEAIEHIDRQLGKGYAEKHPELIAKFMEVAAADYHTATTCKIIGGALEDIAEQLFAANKEIEGIGRSIEYAADTLAAKKPVARPPI